MHIESLTNLAASTGYTKLYVYSTGDAKATIKASGYFNEALHYGLSNNDVILVQCSDAIYHCKVVVVGETVTTEALDTFA